MEGTQKMILAGDVGGTNTRLALFEEASGRWSPKDVRIFPSGRYSGLSEIIREYMAGKSVRVTGTAFGLAGPVREGLCELPNLSWAVDSREIEEETGLGPVSLINDLEANAYGIEMLESRDFEILREGVPYERGNAALISPGTGLGEAGIHRVGDRCVPFATEGGHTDFAPRNEIEMSLLQYLLNHYDHVSYERVVSGPGLLAIYRFLGDTGRGEEIPSVGEELRAADDPPAVISNAALEGRCPLSTQAVDLFVSLLGSEAGNFALKVLATAGIYLGGGIVPKILPKLREPPFLDSLTAKGRMKKLLGDMPVKIILNDRTALLGAARYASTAGRLEGK